MYVDDLNHLMTIDEALASIPTEIPQAVVLDGGVEFRPLDDKRVVVAGVDGEHVFSRDAVLDFSRQLGIPRAYAEKIPVDLLLTNWQYWLNRDSKFKGWAVERGPVSEIVGIGPEHSMYLPPASVINVLGDAMREYGTDDLRVYSINSSYSDFVVRLVDGGREHEPIAGDLFLAGLSFGYSPVDSRPMTVEGFNVRLVCTNGMLNTEAVERLSRRSRPDDPLRWIYEAGVVTWALTDDQFERIAEANSVAIPRAHVAEVLNGIFVQYHVPVRLREQILSSVLESGQLSFSLMDLINHITYVASHDPDVTLTQQERLFRAADVALQHQHICESCYRPI